MRDGSQDPSRQQDRHVGCEGDACPADDVGNHPHAKGAESAHTVHDIANKQDSEHGRECVNADCNTIGFNHLLHHPRKSC